MIGFYKRRIFVVIVLILIFLFSFVACDSDEENNDDQTENLSKFSVTFIDVDDGDCILIVTPNGNSMLIDTGAKSTYQRVKTQLTSFGVTVIDYLVLSNPMSQHVGAVGELLNDFTVNKAYIPNILDLNYFSFFKQALDSLTNKNVETEITYQNEHFNLDGLNVAFLSPSVNIDGAYNALNSQLSPSKYEIGNVSPIIYCEYNSVRFIFTGDADKTQENFVIDTYNSGIYQNALGFYGVHVNLKEIDVLKVSSHGDNNATCKEFLELIKPKNAVISVSARNTDCPSSSVISRLIDGKENYGLFRTDVHGNVSVYVEENGEYTIKTQK